jgi:hypothetical protein
MTEQGTTTTDRLAFSALTTDALVDAIYETGRIRKRLVSTRIPSPQRDEIELRLLARRRRLRVALAQRGELYEVSPWETERSVRARFNMIGDLSRWSVSA